MKFLKESWVNMAENEEIEVNGNVGNIETRTLKEEHIKGE